MALLIVIAMVWGLFTTLVVQWTTRAGVLRETRKRMEAHLLEFRLFFDEPALVWRAQIELLRDNARVGRALLPASLLLVMPSYWVFVQLDTVYGFRSLRVGEETVVTAQLTRPNAATDHLDLLGSSGLKVESSAVRTFADHQISWRIRAVRDIPGTVELKLNDRAIRKAVAVGDSPQFRTPRRSRSMTGFLLYPAEPRLAEGDISWVAVDYPHANSKWVLWFVGFAVGSAWASARWLKVA